MYQQFLFLFLLAYLLLLLLKCTLIFIQLLLEQIVPGALRKVINDWPPFLFGMGDGPKYLFIIVVFQINVMRMFDLVGRVRISLPDGHVYKVLFVAYLYVPVIQPFFRARSFPNLLSLLHFTTDCLLLLMLIVFII